MRRPLLMLCLLSALALTTSGCRKKSAAQFYDAKGRYEVLTARLGDDAYAEEDMATVESILKSVPDKAREADQAKALLAHIASERSRIANEKAASELALKRAAQVPSAAAPPSPAVRPLAAPSPVNVAADAGVELVTGLPLATFLKAYGACMESAPDMLMPGSKTPGKAFAVRKEKKCLDQFGGDLKLTKMFVFIDDKLVGEATRTEPDTDKPYAGMSSADFMKNFGSCMTSSPDVTMPGAKTPSQAYAVKNDKACHDKFGGTAEVTKTYVFNDGKLVGESTVQTKTSQPPAAAIVPGAPLPAGYETGLPPPDPSTAVTPDSRSGNQ